MTMELPQGFEDLSDYAPRWAMGKYSQRQNARLGSDIAEIRDFYDAMMPRFESIVDHLNEYSLDDMPAPQQTLLNMCLSLAQIGNCVALWHAPDQQDAFSAERMEPLLDD
jgi:hypothetical protein